MEDDSIKKDVSIEYLKDHAHDKIKQKRIIYTDTL
jgi:hypothetical protein